MPKFRDWLDRILDENKLDEFNRLTSHLAALEDDEMMDYLKSRFKGVGLYTVAAKWLKDTRKEFNGDAKVKKDRKLRMANEEVMKDPQARAAAKKAKEREFKLRFARAEHAAGRDKATFDRQERKIAEK